MVLTWPQLLQYVTASQPSSIYLSILPVELGSAITSVAELSTIKGQICYGI